ncbi:MULTISPECIES: MATE family efflux transporter [unclassified Clostridium]|uniref:MATE family efflux transporter n=1 Tax=unclassified Clostridium TaxID=2614128 RepID=UPI0002979F7B|nr:MULTISPECIES: MATE family efflux transporter [unclassified Clostridium]EKQ56025.1 MAG: putative efflux protein, MATE family [Clostridium sp. Maddingley MBC34-26]
MNNQKRLGEMGVGKLLLEFSIPAIIGMLVNTLYNIIDRVFIGHIQGIGNLAMAGVGVAMPLMIIILAFGLLIGIGTATQISIKLGEHDKESAEKLLGNAFTLIIIISIFLTLFGLIFANPLLKMFGASENILGYGEEFIQVIFVGCIFNMISFGLNHSIRSDGSPKIAMASMLMSAIINIILDPIFIFGLGLGVRGGALGTVVAQFISSIWILYYFTKGSSTLKIKKKNLRLDRKIVLSIIAIGVSPFSMQIAQSAVQIVANNLLQEYGGDIAVSAMTIIGSLAMVFLMPIFGLNQGLQPIIGYNFGAKQYDRVKKAVKYGAVAATVIVTIGFIVIQGAAEILVIAFNDDPSLIEVTSHGMRIFLIMLPFVGGQIIVTNYFQSIGNVKISMLLSLLRQVIILIPCLIIIPIFKGLDGIWIAGAVSDFLSVIITVLVFIKKSKDLVGNKKIQKVALEN